MTKKHGQHNDKVIPDVSEEKDRTYFAYYGMLMHQQNMLLDTIRTSTYHNAITRNQADFTGKVVVDVGAGTGILSFFAIQAGAKRVYAVEASEMAQKAKQLVEANGLSDRIIVLQGRVEEINLPEPADIIISEPMGVMLVHERMMESLIIARDRFLRPPSINGSPAPMMFPASGNIYFSPFTDISLYADAAQKMDFWKNSNFYGIDLNSLIEPAVKGYFGQAIVGPIDPRSFLSRSQSFTFDFLKVSTAEMQNFSVDLDFAIELTGIVHGLAGWFDVAFNGSQLPTILSTAPSHETTHWYQVRFLFINPIAVNLGQRLRGKITFQANNQRSHDITIELRLEGTLIQVNQKFYMQDQLYWNLSAANSNTVINKEMMALYDGFFSK